MLIPLGVLAASGAARELPTYELLSTTTLTGTVANVTLSLSAFSEYKHLQIRIVAKADRGAGGDDFTIRFNGDSAANYSTHILIGSGSSMLSYGYGSGSMFVPGAASSSASTSTAAAVIDILDAYSTTKNKVFRAFSGEAPGVVGTSSGSWYNTASLTSIQFLPVYASGILSGSRFSVYGIRG